MDEKIEKVAKAGFVSKGIVYALTGILAFGAASGLGGSSEGKLGVLKFLEEQPFGKVLLGVLGLGLLCYAFWRFFQSLADPENIGSEPKAIAKRTGFFISGSVYLGLGLYSIYEIFANTGGSGSSKGTSMLPPESLTSIFYAVAIGMAIKSIFQLIKAFKGDFLDKFHLDTIFKINIRKTIKWLGYAGLTARGIVVGIVAYFFFRAADTASKGDIKGTAEAFSFLRQSYGPWLMGAVALGLICYGAYMFVMAKYRKFDDRAG